MPYADQQKRNQRARLRYAAEPEIRERARERSRAQRQRLKTDPDYREKRNAWQRRWRDKDAASREPNGPAR